MLARGLGTVPCSPSVPVLQEAFRVFSSSQIEWLVAATAMFGSFNKLMDGLNIPFELDTCQETVDLMDNQCQMGVAGVMLPDANQAEQQRLPPPPKDDWTNCLDILCQGLCPGGALALKEKSLQGTPVKAEECAACSEQLCGCSFQGVLQSLWHN